MRCQYLSNIEGRKICRRMLEEGKDAEVSDFDVQHFCVGNPMCCYYYRTPPKQPKTQQKDVLKDKITHLFTEASRSVEVETRR